MMISMLLHECGSNVDLSQFGETVKTCVGLKNESACTAHSSGDDHDGHGQEPASGPAAGPAPTPGPAPATPAPSMSPRSGKKGEVKTRMTVNNVDYTQMTEAQKDEMTTGIETQVTAVTGVPSNRMTIGLTPGSVNVEVVLETDGVTSTDNKTAAASIADKLVEGQALIEAGVVQHVVQIKDLKTTGEVGVTTIDTYFVKEDGQIDVPFDSAATSAPTPPSTTQLSQVSFASPSAPVPLSLTALLALYLASLC